MYHEPAGAARRVAETVVDEVPYSCKSNVATRLFAPPILLSLLRKTLTLFWRKPRKKKTDPNCSADYIRQADIYLPRWGNVLPALTP